MQSLKSRVLYHVVKYQLAKLGQRQLALPEYRLARDAAAQRSSRFRPTSASMSLRWVAARANGCGRRSRVGRA